MLAPFETDRKVEMSQAAEVVDAQLDAYNARDLERFIASYAPGVVISSASGDVLAEGHGGLRQMYSGLFQDSPQLEATILNRIEVGGYVADHEAVRGFILPGSPTSFDAIAAYSVVDGKITRVTLYF